MTTIPPTAPAIAFLGTGRMGAPMAANLARGGFGVRVWNRTISRAEALTADGAVVASSPAQAVRGAAIVITMLADGPATEQAATGPDGLLAAGPGTIWVQMATVGAEWTARLASIADARGIVFVDAPVSGSEGPAQAGELVILASGPQTVRDILAPVFGAVGRATAWLGPAGHGTRAKLVLNSWLADLTEATAETLSFARRLDLDPAEIVDLLQSTPLGAPYAVQKARSMLAGELQPRIRAQARPQGRRASHAGRARQRRHPHPHQRAAPPLAGHRSQRACRRRPLRGLPHNMTGAAERRTFAAGRGRHDRGPDLLTWLGFGAADGDVYAG